MRIPQLLPADVSGSQKVLYDDMRKGIETQFNVFRAIESG